MYPNLYYAFRDLFGVEWPALRVVNSFGFFVAVSFILAAVTLSAELKRKAKQNLLEFTEVQVTVGKPATAAELILNFLLGFVLGYKFIGLFLMDKAAQSNPQEFIFSTVGHWPAGIGLGLLLAGLKWYEKNKQKLPKPEERKLRLWPHDRVGEITILALIFGLFGAKLFDAFENWSTFIKDPSSIFSPEGLTFYGGLICAALAIWWYARKHKINFLHLSDAAAPGLMLAYAVGRVGCQVAGDGDWGITNTSPKPFSWMPDWLWAYSYPHNVSKADEHILIPNCDWGEYCHQLAAPAFPTPLYETIAGLLIFAILWFIRKRIKTPGILFGIYLMFNGVERFLVEKIRVNNRLDIFGFHPTQAEVISFSLFVAGALLIWFRRKKGSSPSQGG